MVDQLTEAFSSLQVVPETPVTAQECSSSDSDLPSILLTHTLSNNPVHPNPPSASTPSLPTFSLEAAHASMHAIINQPPSQATTAATTASQPSNAWARKALNVIVAAECQVHQASEILPLLDQCTLDNADLQRLLDSTAEVIESAGRSLAAVKHKDGVVQKRKAEVIAVLRDLDNRVGKLGKRLPHRHPDTAPILVDAGEDSICLLNSLLIDFSSYF
jgi:hypothetical protein